MTSAKINEEWCYPPRGFDVFNRRIDPQCVSTHCALLWLYYWPKCCSIILNETIKWRRKIPRSDQLSVKSTFKVICSTSCARCDTITYEDADKDANEIEINHDNKLIPTFWNALRGLCRAKSEVIRVRVARLFHSFTAYKTLRLACGHIAYENMETKEWFILEDDDKSTNSNPTTEVKCTSWEDGIRRLFETSMVSTSSGQPFCSTCGSYQPSSTRQYSITELNESIMITRGEPTFACEYVDGTSSNVVHPFDNIRYTPWSIPPVIDLDRYNEPQRKTASNNRSTIETLEFQTITYLLQMLPSRLPLTLIQLMADYTYSSTRYWLQSIVLGNGVNARQTSLIVRCLPTQIMTNNAHHMYEYERKNLERPIPSPTTVGFMKNREQQEQPAEWWYINENGTHPISAYDLFIDPSPTSTRLTTSATTMSRAFPLTQAIALRYQRE